MNMLCGNEFGRERTFIRLMLFKKLIKTEQKIIQMYVSATVGPQSKKAYFK